MRQAADLLRQLVIVPQSGLWGERVQIVDDLQKILLCGGKIFTSYFSMDALPQLTGHCKEIFPLRAGGYLLLRHGQLSVKVDERLLPLILLHTEDYHVAAALRVI